MGGTLSALMSSASQFAYFIDPEFISRRSCFTYELMTRFAPVRRFQSRNISRRVGPLLDDEV